MEHRCLLISNRDNQVTKKNQGPATPTAPTAIRHYWIYDFSRWARSGECAEWVLPNVCATWMNFDFFIGICKDPTLAFLFFCLCRFWIPLTFQIGLVFKKLVNGNVKGAPRNGDRLKSVHVVPMLVHVESCMEGGEALQNILDVAFLGGNFLNSNGRIMPDTTCQRHINGLYRVLTKPWKALLLPPL